MILLYVTKNTIRSLVISWHKMPSEKWKKGDDLSPFFLYLFTTKVLFMSRNVRNRVEANIVRPLKNNEDNYEIEHFSNLNVNCNILACW